MRESEKRFKEIDMIKEKLIEVLLKSAMNFEEETYRFYMKCMENESDRRVSELFRKLADEELKHKARLESVMTTDPETILNAEDSDLPGEVDVPEIRKEEIPRSSDKAVEVLTKALESETSARNFYSLLSKRSALSVLKKTFHFLAKQEDKHIEAIQSMLDEMDEG